MPTKSIELTVVTANIGRKHASKENVRQNIGVIKRAAAGAVIGFQEIDEADAALEHNEKVDGLPQHSFASLKQLCPIAVPKMLWQITADNVTPTCKGRKHVTPPRVVVTARIKSVFDPDFPPVIIMNGHYPHGAKDLWKVCQSNWKKHVEEIHGKGLTIITTRDVNFHEEDDGPLPALHQDERQLIKQGIDRITVIQAPASSRDLVKVRAGNPRVIDLDIDNHNAHAVDLTLTADVG